MIDIILLLLATIFMLIIGAILWFAVGVLIVIAAIRRWAGI